MNNQDLQPGREITVEIADEARMEVDPVFAVCVETDDENALVLMKIYQVKPRGDKFLVIDEEGETAVYPASFFMPLKFAPALESVLTQVKR